LIISSALYIKGTVSSEGEIQVEGRIHGDVRCKSLILSESAELNGNAIAEEVMVKGRLVGCIKARRARLECKCRVEGDIFHQELAVAEGAFFEGMSQPCIDPIHGRTGIQLALSKAKADGFWDVSKS
jgi:cytoskeletal protein CcmA (bactofilin family)